MALTASQMAAIKADILANPDLNAQPLTSDGAFEIARLYALPASPSFYVFRTNIPTQEVFNGVTWANLTPNEAPDGTQAWANRSLACQGKQFNLQTLLVGQTSIDASKVNLRAGLQDALTNVPSGAGGATVAAGWVGIRDGVLARAASRLEKLLATVTVQQDGSTPAKAATMTREGSIGYQDIADARNS